MKKIIINYNNQTKGNLDLINENCIEVEFTFNTNELVQYVGKGSECACPAWQRLGFQFDKIPSPVVYWFSLDPSADETTVFDAALTCKQAQDLAHPDFRHLPAMHVTCPSPSKTLYVGCCASTSLMNRMFWHFGYYRTGKTQGLQLCHWSRSLNLAITIHALSFPKEAKDLIYVYEKIIAGNLKPILGK